jgi:2-polyprenyl-3-methyl-5-hydroxy-6-metoxy-1,4-benzoquinol methylase
MKGYGWETYKKLNFNRIVNFFNDKRNGSGTMKYISNLDELDQELAYVDSQFKISDDCGRIALSNFCYKIKTESIPNNPYSTEYYDFQMKLYSILSGRSVYTIANEESVFNQEEIQTCPFPYYTCSASTVGDQLLAIGYIIKKTNLPANLKVIEFGPGWGNLTLALAQMGHNVTCVEVEKRFIELIKYRTREINNQVNFFHQDMLKFSETPDKKYDAVFFYESFHHCRDPIKLIKNLSNVINTNGIICFASEPIISSPSEIIPYPWGIRLDGMSVWSIRRFGWMELGFDIDFFLKMLYQQGFEAEKLSSDVCSLTNLIIARRV